ncbi:MAG: PAS domain S-box protein [Methanomicrobiaceae archaeon]|nr:PAS domain S-box protein [Methanomicrobiaceae archaeon]
MDYIAPYFILMFTSGTVLLLLVVMAIFRRKVKGAISYSAMMIAVCIWSYLYALALQVSDPMLIAFFSKYAFIAMTFVPVLWICFVLDYTGREKYITRLNVGLLLIVPVISIIISFTNDVHQIFYSVSIIRDSLGVSLVSGQYGFWYYVHTLYSYTLLFSGMAYLFVIYLDSPRVYRSQIALVIVGGMLPWLGNLLYIISILPDIYFDMTPYFYALTGLTIYVALFRMPLLKILPIARDSVVENMNDGVMVLDSNRMIVEMNPAALGFFDIEKPKARSIFLEDLHPDFYDFIKRHEGENEFEDLYVNGKDDEVRYFNVKSSLLLSGERNNDAVILIIRDVTESIMAEKEIAESEEKFRMLYDNLIDAALLYEVPENSIFGKILEANSAAEEISGFTKDELYNLSVDLLSRNIQEERSAKLLETLKEKGYVRFETDLIRKYGSRIPVIVSSHIFQYKGKKVVLSLIRDISFEKEMRRKEKEALVQIESNIEQLSILNDAVRNPLSIIVGLASLGEFEGSEDIIRQAEIIDDIVDRLDRNCLESEKIRKFLMKHCKFIIFDDES